MTNELLRILERRIIRSYLYLREDRYDISPIPGFAQSIFQRLLQHVTDPSSGASYEYAERQWRYLASRLLVSHQLVAHLRPVTVYDDHPPAVESKVDDRAQTLSRMPELVGNGGVLTGRREGISPDGDDSCARRVSHLRGGAIKAPRES